MCLSLVRFVKLEHKYLQPAVLILGYLLKLLTKPNHVLFVALFPMPGTPGHTYDSWDLQFWTVELSTVYFKIYSSVGSISTLNNYCSAFSILAVNLAMEYQWDIKHLNGDSMGKHA